MPPKRVMRPRSSSSSESSSSDDDVPIEISFKSTKQQALDEQTAADEFVKKREALRKAKITSQQEEQRLVVEKKRKKIAKKQRIEDQRAVADDQDDEDDNQVVQLSTSVTSHKLSAYDDFDFSEDALLSAAKTQSDVHKQEQEFTLKHQIKQQNKVQQDLQAKLQQQQTIARLLNEKDSTTSKFRETSRRVGRFQINVQKEPTVKRSAHDLLAMAHGFTPGSKVRYHQIKLQPVPRVHASTDSRFSRHGVSNTLLDRGLTSKERVNKAAKASKTTK